MALALSMHVEAGDWGGGKAEIGEERRYEIGGERRGGDWVPRDILTATRGRRKVTHWRPVAASDRQTLQ
jgi:hypothetical protein